MYVNYALLKGDFWSTLGKSMDHVEPMRKELSGAC